MTLTEADLLHFLTGAFVLLVAANAVGALFVRWRQPRVIGEILGGFLLGATALGALAPGVQGSLVPSDGDAATALAAISQLGLIWLMFAAGTQLKALPGGRERTIAGAIVIAGTAVPFAVGAATFALLRPSGLTGPADDTVALGLVFTAALALTSIPVISRIMLDLGLLSSSFARTILGAAVIEDIVLFAVLGIAVGLAQNSAEASGLASLLGIGSGSLGGALYYGTVVAGSLLASVALARRRSPLLERMRRDPTCQLLLILGTVAGMLLLSAPPLFGGLVAGLIVGGGEGSEATDHMKDYGLRFFVPIYFAIVGFRLDLGVLQPGFFVAFALFACAVKAGGVYLGARLVRVRPHRARDFAIAMNARGGPGIVLATVALEAKIIDAGFYASLVMLAIFSSLFAGWWLERAVERDGPESFGLDPGPRPPLPAASPALQGTALGTTEP